MTKVQDQMQDQMPDLRKSINVFNNNPNAKNPFLEAQNKPAQPNGASSPSTESIGTAATGVTSSEHTSDHTNVADAI